MTEFQPTNPRGAFIASVGATGAPTPFAPMAGARAAAFTAGLHVKPAQAEPPVPQSHQAHKSFPDAPAPVVPQQSALERLSEEMVTENNERERIRAAEHAVSMADLERQKTRNQATNDRLGQLAGELVRLREAMVHEVRGQAGALLLLGARRLAGEGLRGEAGLLEALVRRTVDSLGGGSVVVRVNPEDVESLAAALNNEVRLVSDPSIHAGCIAESDFGSIDATVDGAAGSLLAEVHAWKRTA